MCGSIRLLLSRIAIAAIGLAFTATAQPTFAQEATTFASSFAVPVFNQIDQNGVDLVTGTWRVKTPTIWIGEGAYRQERGMQWTGQSWTHIDQPSLWKDGSKYIVMYKGGSHEFNGFGSGFSKRVPIDGSSLNCDTLSGDNGVRYCRFTSRDGDFVVFQGFFSAMSNYGPNIGLSSLQFGNVGIMEVLVSEVFFGSPPIYRQSNQTYARGSSFVRDFGYQETLYGSLQSDIYYNTVNYLMKMGDQTIKINTPNNDAVDEHYMRPKGTTQTITDDFGNQWGYTFNNDRDLLLITQPGGASSISATYYGNHKVKTITTVAGTWNYTYSDFGTYGSTTVVNPKNETTYVKYHRDNGYVTEVRDPLNRSTLYTWNDTTRRLERVTMPEGNYVAFTYDARGNVLTKTEVAKGGGSSMLWQANYAASCSAANQANCNQPDYMIDPKGNQTDMEYTGNSPGPTKIALPAATPGAPRSTVINVYSDGSLVRSATCRTLAVCAGTADEVVTEYRYQNLAFENTWRFDGYIGGNVRVLGQVKVTADGQTFVTCYQYDNKGRRVATTPPNANIAICPYSFSSALPVGANPPTITTRAAPTYPGGQ